MTMPTEETNVSTAAIDARVNTPTDKLNAAQGQTIDSEGLANNYAIEPEMYVEDGSAVTNNPSDQVTLVDIFDSKIDAKNAVLEIEKKGMQAPQISLLAKGYAGEKNYLSWENIEAEGGLAAVLTKLGISKNLIEGFVSAIEEGKYILIVVGSDREASQTQHVLESIGHSLI